MCGDAIILRILYGYSILPRFFFFCRSTIYQSTLERAITVLASEREGEWEREEAFVCMNE